MVITRRERPDLTTDERAELARLIASSPRPSTSTSSPRPSRAPSAGLDLVERRQLAETGSLVALELAGGNPLEPLPPLTRAVAVLLTIAAEDPTMVGLAVLHGQDPVHSLTKRRLLPTVQRAHLRALDALDDARAAIQPAPLPPRLPRPVLLAVRRTVPAWRPRWAFWLRSSGAFPSADDIATAIRIDRATVYRDLDQAHRSLSSLSRS